MKEFDHSRDSLEEFSLSIKPSRWSQLVLKKQKS